MSKLITVLIVVTFVVSGGCLSLEPNDGDGRPAPEQDETPVKVPPTGSGLWTPFEVSFEDPSYEYGPLDYDLPLANSDVMNLGELGLSDAQEQFLLANGMMGLAGSAGYKSFAAAYERIQDKMTKPTFITSDSILDAYHHIFESVLIELEENGLTENAKTMARNCMWASDAQMASLPEDESYLARLNVVYFGVALRVFDPGADVPDHAVDDVERVIGLIDDATTLEAVAGFKQREDFTQYKPRGHYTRSEELSRYFKGMMWLGRITFQNKQDDEVRRAVLAAVALKGDEAAWKAYTSMCNVIDFMVGHPDDLTPVEVLGVVDEVIGPVEDDLTPLFDDAKLEKLREALDQVKETRISSDVVNDTDADGNGVGVKGMRVFGQRYVPDSYIFQQCVYSALYVKRLPLYLQRMMPTCLDVFSVLGSEEALGREDLETYAPEFEERITELREEFESYPDEVWSSTLYWSWLHSLRSIHEEVPDQPGPAFMQTRAWSAKELNAQAASWTQLTHDTILYRKQSYTTVACCLPPPPSDIVYVEPVPVLYSRLADMVEATREGLETLGFASDLAYGKLDSYASTLDLLERVAIQELEGKVMSETDRDALKLFYYRLEKLNKMGDGEDTKTILVSDVHTDPNNEQVLQEAVGPVRLVLVVVPTEAGNYAAFGAVFEHHEFTWPMDDRLTDEQWTAMLEDGTAPEPAPWAKDFILG